MRVDHGLRGALTLQPDGVPSKLRLARWVYSFCPLDAQPGKVDQDELRLIIRLRTEKGASTTTSGSWSTS